MKHIRPVLRHPEYLNPVFNVFSKTLTISNSALLSSGANLGSFSKVGT